MKLYVDLHMHSCLSPCADDDMTPNNIAGMAHLKGLDAIAVSDHNAARNLPTLEKTCAELGVVLLPALECTTAEEVHLLTYFPDVPSALAFDEAIQPLRMRVPNRPALWGRQIIMDEDDEEMGEDPDWLVPALSMPLDDLAELCKSMGGVAVPAHINRGQNGLLNVLGFVPPGAGYAALELSSQAPAPTADLSSYKILYSSDAHNLADISEPKFFIECAEKSTQALFAALTAGKSRK